jgi:metallo-beta-lactamase family protein
MLADSAYIQELDAKWYNKKAARKGLPFIQPIYNLSHAEQSMELFISVPYGRRFYINDEISVKFTNTGHMLGSAAINLQIKEENEIKRITYTGDIGRPHNRILKAPEPFLPCDYLITESTYGNRTHEATEATEQQFLQVVRDTCIQRRGKLIIPSFSIGRTQEIVYILNKLYNQGDLPEYIDVFVDSPLSVNATEIFRLYADSMNEDVKQTMITDKDPFGFNSLH